MSIAEKLTQIAENEQKVYEAGKQAAYDAFWDAYQSLGAPKDYSNMFSGDGWNNATFQPKYNMTPSSCYMMFRKCQIEGDLVAILEKQGLSIDTSQASSFQYFMNNSRKITRVGKIIAKEGVSFDGAFGYCTLLETVDSIELSKGCNLRSIFDGCTALKNITFSGNISSDIDLHWSTKLSKASIENVCNNAWGGYVDSYGNPVVTLSLEAVNRAYETGEGLSDGATSPAWTELINDAWSLVQITLI